MRREKMEKMEKIHAILEKIIVTIRRLGLAAAFFQFHPELISHSSFPRQVPSHLLQPCRFRPMLLFLSVLSIAGPVVSRLVLQGAHSSLTPDMAPKVLASCPRRSSSATEQESVLLVALRVCPICVASQSASQNVQLRYVALVCLANRAAHT
jgi:hypothetical protein